VEEGGELRAALGTLLAERSLARADGRPLYSYRFTRTEYEAIAAQLRARGSGALAERAGAALFVAFTAEWFRRDRSGGHWDWIRPLAAIGVRYHNQDPASDIAYPQIRDAIETGLAAWARAAPTDHDWVLAIVREAGFPASATRMDPRLSTWLKRSVLAIERGFSPQDAVAMEGWRASERIVRALSEAAIALCTSIADLRSSIPVADRAADPVAKLDARRPEWRRGLPFDMEARDVASLVEEVLRVRADRSTALWASRRLVRLGAGWQARVTLELSGDVDHARMPAGLRDRLGGLGRLRLVARGELVDQARPFAALERDRDDGRDAWEVRPLVTTFDRRLPLHADLRLGALIGDHVAGEFIAFGGEAMDAGVAVLEPPAGEDPETVPEFAVLGAGPVRSRATWLALVITPENLARVEFEDRVADLGGVDGTSLHLVAFRGRASLEVDGVRRIWQSDSAEDQRRRMVLVGETLRGVREQVFLGIPKVWMEEGGVCAAPPLSGLRWRPRGRGEWRPLLGAAPVGRIDIGVTLDGEVVDSMAAAVAPAQLRLRGRIQPRALQIAGHGGARVAARGLRPLPVDDDGVTAVVDLDGLAPGDRLTLELQADGRLDMTLDDPSASEVLVTPDGTIARRRVRLVVGRLQGYRLLAAQGGRLHFELDAGARRGSHFTRAVEGLVPLGAFDDEIRNLLGGADRLDVDVRLTWLGQSDRAAEVGWYERTERRHDEVRPDAPVRRGAFALLRPQDGTLDDAPAATSPGAAEALRQRLGPGPWLVYATGGQGEVLRPRLVRDPISGPIGPLAAAVGVTLQADRTRAFDQLFTGSSGAEPELLRWCVDMLVLARRVGLPLTALDGATALCRNPVAAVRALAACDSLEERAAVLALQRDLSFLWCATPLTAWLDGFAARRTSVAARLAGVGIDATEALRYLLAALGEISDLQANAAAHVRLTFLLEIHGRMPKGRAPLDPVLERRLIRGVPAAEPRELLRKLASDLVARRVDVDLPPRDLRLAGVVAGGGDIVAEINPAFRDVAAAPYVAAALAAGLADPSHALRERCREAWLFDPDYFEQATPIALTWLAGAPAAPVETAP
jgi:hypothetical protein